jgi:hypothetical protein
MYCGDRRIVAGMARGGQCDAPPILGSDKGYPGDFDMILY